MEGTMQETDDQILQRIEERRLRRERLRIPKIEDDELERRYDRIKPLIRDGKGKAHLIKKPDLRGESYLPSKLLDVVTPGPVIGEFRCLHTWSYYGFFKPSIAEVLAQFPAEMLEKASYFEIVRRPENATDLNEEEEALNAGFHVSNVRVYEKAA
jgi:hypothetical protein